MNTKTSKRWGAVSTLAILMLSGFAQASQEYKIEPGWSHIEFNVKNFGIHTVNGRFKSFAGSISFDDADVSRSTVSVSIQVSSVDTGIKKRDDHLQKEEFFDAAKYPEVTFHSERIEKAGDRNVLIGILSIKGQTKEVQLPFTYKIEKTAEGASILHAEAQANIQRRDFGINYGSNFSVGNDVTITIHIEGLH